MIQTLHSARVVERVVALKESYRHIVASREIDLLEQNFTSRGEAFFHVSGAGHEATGVMASLLKPTDWLHCHYRDKALMLARGISIEMFFLATFNKKQSHSAGRQMNAHMSDPKLNIMSLVGPVGNSALQAVGVAASVASQPEQPIVICALGDGITQQGEVYEAIAHAVRDNLPVFFIVEDNEFAISTKTRGRTFYSMPNSQPDQFYGIPIVRVDGRFPVQVYEDFKTIIDTMRTERGAAIAILEVDRLSNHTNADDQRVYRSADEIDRIWQQGDPIINLRNHLLEQGVAEQELVDLEQEVRGEVQAAAERAQQSPDPEPIFDAFKPLLPELTPGAAEYRGDPNANGQEPLTMLRAIRQTLYNQLAADERVILFGEDIEDPKGDVFGITKGLSKQFRGRVINSPLAEASIVGISVGQALAGKRPVAFLQFADFLPLAYNQIFAELGSMYWRTEGGWQVPVIVMITCGGYRPGLGPFHAGSMEAIAAHTPGIDVFMPSTAGDAAGMLNAAFLSGRPTLFFYPKSCLNESETATSPDIERHLVPIGSARFIQRGSDLTLIGWGNTVKLCRKTADALAEHDVTCDVIDLRSMVPWDKHNVCESARRTGRVIVVHEDNHTVGLGAELLATICETLPNRVEVRRVTRADTFVPCNFGNQLEVLPSFKRTLETAVELLHGTVEWRTAQEDLQEGQMIIEAIGSSPSDETITVIEWHIAEGDSIEKGAIIAELEADKASVELRAPMSGTVDKLIVAEGDSVQIGAPLARVMTKDGSTTLKQITREESGTPIISNIRLSSRPARAASAPVGSDTGSGIGIIAVDGVSGSRIVTNEDISRMCRVWVAGGYCPTYRYRDAPLAGRRRNGTEHRNGGGEAAIGKSWLGPERHESDHLCHRDPDAQYPLDGQPDSAPLPGQQGRCGNTGLRSQCGLLRLHLCPPERLRLSYQCPRRSGIGDHYRSALSTARCYRSEHCANLRRWCHRYITGRCQLGFAEVSTPASTSARHGCRRWQPLAGAG